MKQIKLLFLLVCATAFGSIKAQQGPPVPPLEASIDYVAKYVWNGSVSPAWNNVNNWTLTHNAPPLTVVPGFPGIDATNPAIYAIHHVVIPATATRMPDLLNAPAASYTISDLQIDSAATIKFAGKSLVINGSITGKGLLVTGVGQFNAPSSLSFNSLQKVMTYPTSAEFDAKAVGPFYQFDFSNGTNLPGITNPAPTFGEIDGFIQGGVPQNGYTFPTSNGYIMTASAAPGGLFLFDGIPSNPTVQPDPNAPPTTIGARILSTLTETDPLVISFAGGAPVYSFSANFSLTDFDGETMFVGKRFDPNTDNDPAINDSTTVSVNDLAVSVTLSNGDVHTYTAENGGVGVYIGFVSPLAITSVTVESLLFDLQVQPGGFCTIDDIKFGTRGATGSVSFDQTSSATRQLGSLTINSTTATAPINTIGSVTVANPVEVIQTLDLQSGVLNTSPIVPTASNLTLLSSQLGSASVASHTADGVINGRVNVQRYIAAGRNKQWRFLGLPYSNTIAASTIGGITYNLVTPTMMTYNETLGAIGNGTTGSGGTKNSGYQNIDGNSTIAPGRGFAAWIYDANAGTTISAPQSMTTTGVLNESGLPVQVDLDFLSAGVANSGWNLVSNPYASTIDWDQVALTRVTPTVYRWDPELGGWATWNPITNTSVNGGDNFIESGSSFFVRVTAPVDPLNPETPSLVFDQAIKQGAAISQLNQFSKNNVGLGIGQQVVGKRTSQVSDKSGIRFKVTGQGNPLPSDAYLGLNIKDATAAFDNQYDAYAMGRSNGASVAVQAADKTAFAVQFDRPITEVGKEKRFYPITVSAPSTGATKLDIEIEGTWNSLNTVHLIDKKEGKTIPLSGKKLNYEFNLTNTKEEDRFVLAVNYTNVGEKSGITASDVRVVNNPVKSDIIDAIIAHPSSKAKNYSIINGSGATLNVGTIADNNSVQHQLRFGKTNASGVMYLKVDFDNGDSKTVKFIKL